MAESFYYNQKLSPNLNTILNCYEYQIDQEKEILFQEMKFEYKVTNDKNTGDLIIKNIKILHVPVDKNNLPDLQESEKTCFLSGLQKLEWNLILDTVIQHEINNLNLHLFGKEQEITSEQGSSGAELWQLQEGIDELNIKIDALGWIKSCLNFQKYTIEIIEGELAFNFVFAQNNNQ